MSTNTEHELVDLRDAAARLASAQRVPVAGSSSPILAALDTLEALIAEAHVARRAGGSQPPDVAELVNTVIDAAGRMLETVHGVAYANEHAPRVAEIEAELKAERVKVYDLGVANRQLIEERDAARRDRASFAESAQHHIDELRDEIKARAAQYAADADMYSKAIDEKHARIRELEGREGDLRRELANLELALAEARGDVEA